jgi:hypothetical protein
MFLRIRPLPKPIYLQKCLFRDAHYFFTSIFPSCGVDKTIYSLPDLLILFSYSSSFFPSISKANWTIDAFSRVRIAVAGVPT